MTSVQYYDSPLGRIRMAADEIGLTGLWFEGQKYFALYLDKEHIEKAVPVLCNLSALSCEPPLTT